MGKQGVYVPQAIQKRDELQRVRRRAVRGAHPVERIAARRRLSEHEEAMTILAVYEARELHDMSWTVIGEALGISKQATLQRFGPGSPLYRAYAKAAKKRGQT